MPEDFFTLATSADFDANGALSRDFLLRRGRCGEEGCRSCPYGFVPELPERDVPNE